MLELLSCKYFRKMEQFSHYFRVKTKICTKNAALVNLRRLKVLCFEALMIFFLNLYELKLKIAFYTRKSRNSV
jgi:hypothetical protein